MESAKVCCEICEGHGVRRLIRRITVHIKSIDEANIFVKRFIQKSEFKRHLEIVHIEFANE